MHVVQQLHAFWQAFARRFQQLQRLARVLARIVVGARQSAVGPRLIGRAAAVVAQLHAHVAVTFGQDRLGVVEHFADRGAVGVRVRRHRLATLAAEQHVQRQSGALAQDVPQRLIDARERVVQHRAVTPVTVGARRLPNVLDARDVTAE